MLDELKVAARIDFLKAERDRYVVEANRNLASLSAAIAELELLLKPEPVAESEQDNAG